jgi:hypothetical protein
LVLINVTLVSLVSYSLPTLLAMSIELSHLSDRARKWWLAYNLSFHVTI